MKLFLITLLFSSLSTLLSFHTMPLNQEQINSIRQAHLKYQQLIAFAKEKKIDLNYVLSKEEKKQMQQGVGFLREFVPKIKGEAKAQLVGLQDSIEEVGPKGFIDFVEDWVQDFKEYLKKFKNEDVLITTETVRAYLDGKVANPDFKVGGLFYNKIEAQLNALDKKASPKAIAEAISTGLDNFDASLKEIYKKDKADYRAIKKKDLRDNILKPKDFYTWMQTVAIPESEKEQAETEKEKTIRRWLEGEMENLGKASFGNDMEIDCDSFKLSLALSLGNEIQQLLTANIGSYFINVYEACYIIRSNITFFLSARELSEIFLSKYDLIINVKNNDVVVSSFKGNFKDNSEFVGKLLEQGFYLVAKTIIDITIEGSSDGGYIDVQSLRLNSSQFCKEHLLKTSEKWMSLSAFSKMIEQCKTSCLKNPSKYSKYIEGNSNFGLDSFVQLIIRNHHRQPPGE